MREQKTHDYREHTRCWGHDYTWRPGTGGLTGDAIGWGYGLKSGDLIVFSNGEHTATYVIEGVSYWHDPPDMWRARRLRYVGQPAGKVSL